MEKQNKMLMEQNSQLLKNTEQEFLNSQTYIEMQERIAYLESSEKFNQAALTDAETKIQEYITEIIQFYEDHENFLINQDDTNHDTEIRKKQYNMQEYENLKQEINRLKGHISAKDILIIQRDKEIKKLHEKIAKLRKEKETKNNDFANKIDIKEIEEQMQKKADSKKKKRGRKPEISEETIKIIMTLHQKGYSMRNISEQFGISVGWIHEIIRRNTEHNS